MRNNFSPNVHAISQKCSLVHNNLDLHFVSIDHRLCCCNYEYTMIHNQLVHDNLPTLLYRGSCMTIKFWPSTITLLHRVVIPDDRPLAIKAAITW